jgi:hypothetical protein
MIKEIMDEQLKFKKALVVTGRRIDEREKRTLLKLNVTVVKPEDKFRMAGAEFDVMYVWHDEFSELQDEAIQYLKTKDGG